MGALSLATEHPGPCPGCRTLLGATRRRMTGLSASGNVRASRCLAKSAPLNDNRAQPILDAVVRVSGVLVEKRRSVLRRALVAFWAREASSAELASPKTNVPAIFTQVALSKFVRKVGGTLEQMRHIWELAQQLAVVLGIVSPAFQARPFGAKRATARSCRARGSVAMGLGAEPTSKSREAPSLAKTMQSPP
jgi:hypothetical protein